MRRVHPIDGRLRDRELFLSSALPGAWRDGAELRVCTHITKPDHSLRTYQRWRLKTARYWGRALLPTTTAATRPRCSVGLSHVHLHRQS